MRMTVTPRTIHSSMARELVVLLAKRRLGAWAEHPSGEGNRLGEGLALTWAPTVQAKALLTGQAHIRRGVIFRLMGCGTTTWTSTKFF